MFYTESYNFKLLVFILNFIGLPVAFYVRIKINTVILSVLLIVT
ncbi:hypothetical protein SAMN05443663_102533 [Flavobacterium defluvii]|uniref:Uncharacterized protein n=1 Tax=Flavobacterium defluvii TaxID=370979 RepID=A0A1M5IY99_9FLAO|nr:hypothetical protein SAMN05443663_102533 [Flavobacterium defluvii]